MAGQSPAPSEAQVRGDLAASSLRRGTWIRIAGPLSALFMGIFAALFYLRPIDTLRWMQRTRMGWSGVAQHEVALDDGLMTFLVTGGYPLQEPVIMVHGLGPNAALVWRSVMAPISLGHYKVIAPNLYGFASSEHKQVDYTIGYQARALAQLIDRLKLDRVNLVGHDLGADVILYYAVDHPEKVERLILVAGGLAGKKATEQLRKAMLPKDVEGMREQIEMSLFGLPPMPDFMYRRMMMALAADTQAQTAMLNSVRRDEAHIRSRLGWIFNTLTVVMWGGRDPLYSNARGQSLSVRLPGSATIVFKTSGHYPELEHPEEFADSILFVLKQRQGGR